MLSNNIDNKTFEKSDSEILLETLQGLLQNSNSETGEETENNESKR